jgi:RHS repeat-associated protein
MIAFALNYTDKYSYDLNSNRTTETIENGSGTVTDTVTSTYNADNQLTQSVDANNGTTMYQYDANGSQTEVSSPTGTVASEYTLQDKLAGIQNKISSGTVTSSATYIYDDNGNRIEVTTVTGSNSPVTTYYLVDGNNPTGYARVIEQSATPGTPTISYIWGGSLISQDNAAGTANSGVYYLITDAQGSTQMLVNATGSVVQNYYFDGFGNAVGFTISSAITDYLYNQQYYDVISGQYYLRARNYDPATGTFTQQDSYTINPGDLANANLYLYTGADPINMFDPTGNFGSARSETGT